MAKQVKFLVELSDSSDMDDLYDAFNGISFDEYYLVYCSTVETSDLYPEQAYLTFDVEGSLTDVENLSQLKKLLKKVKINYEFVQVYNEDYD